MMQNLDKYYQQELSLKDINCLLLQNLEFYLQQCQEKEQFSLNKVCDLKVESPLEQNELDKKQQNAQKLSIKRVKKQKIVEQSEIKQKEQIQIQISEIDSIEKYSDYEKGINKDVTKRKQRKKKDLNEKYSIKEGSGKLKNRINKKKRGQKTIKEVEQLIDQWRKGSLNNVRLNESAKKLDISRKTLDDYHAQIKKGKAGNFDFELNGNKLIGYLRRYNHQLNVSLKQIRLQNKIQIQQKRIQIQQQQNYKSGSERKQSIKINFFTQNSINFDEFNSSQDTNKISNTLNSSNSNSSLELMDQQEKEQYFLDCLF